MSVYPACLRTFRGHRNIFHYRRNTKYRTRLQWQEADLSRNAEVEEGMSVIAVSVGDYSHRVAIFSFRYAGAVK